MSTLSAPQVYSLARSAGLDPPSAAVATAIAGAESGWRTDAIGDTGLEDATWGPSVGLWQIRSQKAQYGTGQTRDASRLTDPRFNAQSMVAISGGGKNWNAWSTFNNGAFKNYMGQAAAAANGQTVAGDILLNDTPAGDAAGAAQGVANALGGFGDWQGLAFKLVGGFAAAALIVLGAVHTVSEKG